MRIILKLVLCGVFCSLFLLPVTVAASSQTYFPLNNGDVKSYYYDYNGRLNPVMQLSYISEPSRDGVFIEKDSLDGSQTLYDNRGGKLLMPGIIDAGQYIWFSQPLVVFTDAVIQNGGEYSSSVTAFHQGVSVFISSKTIVTKIDKVSVPAGKYYGCRNISFVVEVRIGGTSQPIVMKNVWTLAPRVGKIQVEVVDTNDNYVDTAELFSGRVNGKAVSDLTGPINMEGAYILLLGN